MHAQLAQKPSILAIFATKAVVFADILSASFAVTRSINAYQNPKAEDLRRLGIEPGSLPDVRSIGH